VLKGAAEWGLGGTPKVFRRAWGVSKRGAAQTTPHGDSGVPPELNVQHVHANVSRRCAAGGGGAHDCASVAWLWEAGHARRMGTTRRVTRTGDAIAGFTK
jgi:hypothetical protein